MLRRLPRVKANLGCVHSVPGVHPGPGVHSEPLVKVPAAPLEALAVAGDATPAEIRRPYRLGI